jgi:hypothetical protein
LTSQKKKHRIESNNGADEQQDNDDEISFVTFPLGVYVYHSSFGSNILDH